MEHIYQNIHGWSGDICEMYQDFVDNASDGAHAVEVGVWKGKSAAYMAVAIINSGKKIKFDCVDTWLGSPGEPSHISDSDVQNGTLYEAFIENMKPVEGYYNAIRLPSVEAAKRYQDQSLDFVFIDADHVYEQIRADILAWLPKVKKGGIIAGHDYISYQGVARAVNEIFKGAHSRFIGSWVYRVNDDK